MSYRLEITTAVLLACAIGVGIWAANRKPREPELDFRASTYLSGPNGSKALHEILVGLGRLSERRRSALTALATERAHRPAILVLVDPIIDLGDDEIEQVVRYVRAGGAVLAVGDGGGVTSCAGWRTQQVRFGDSIGVRALETDAQLPATHRVLTVVPAKSNAARGSLQNRAWRDTDVPVALLPLLTPRPERPGRVAWDEYHQGFGFGNQGSFAGHTWSWLHSTPAGWAILQLIAVALAWLAMTSVRFGPALSVIERRRRSPLEHLEALGAGLESAADADTAIQRLALGLRRRLSRAGHIGNGDLLPWLESLELAMRDPRGRAAVRRLHHLLTARDRDEQRVLLAAQAVEDVWEELRPRTTRNAS